MSLGRRDDALLGAGFARWWAARVPDRHDVTVARLERPAAGWSNETVLVTIAWRDADGARGRDDVVVRLPTLLPTFPVYDLTAQLAVQRALRAGGLPAAEPIAVELDEHWLGAPFLVMARAAGRAIGESPPHDEVLDGASGGDQRRVHEQFLDVLAAVHRFDWSRAGLGDVLRGASGDLRAEIARWRDYVAWAAQGSPTPELVHLLDWCAATAPTPSAVPSLCWGDARLGNVLFDDAWELTAVLDWELASLGPPEMDVAWFCAHEALTDKVARRRIPGFLDPAAAIARYEAALGRPVEHLGWHEVFALVRSAAINEHQARLAAEAGIPYPGTHGPDNPMLRYVARRAERYERATGA